MQYRCGAMVREQGYAWPEEEGLRAFLHMQTTPWVACLLLELIVERRRGDASLHAPYIASLPHGPQGFPGHPAFWTPEMFALANASVAMEASLNRYYKGTTALFQRFLRDLRGPLLAEFGDEVDMDFTPEECAPLVPRGVFGKEPAACVAVGGGEPPGCSLVSRPLTLMHCPACACAV